MTIWNSSPDGSHARVEPANMQERTTLVWPDTRASDAR